VTRLLLPLGISFAVHAGLFMGALAVDPPALKKKPRTIEVSIVEPKKPVPPAIPEPEPEPEKPPEPVKPPPKPPEPKKVAPAPPQPEAPPPPPAPPPKPVAFSVDMESTVTGGEGPVVAAVEGGGNLFADPKKGGDPGPKQVERPPPPASGRGKDPGATGEDVTEPIPLLSEEQRRPPYTQEALSREVEGVMLVELLIGEDGAVRQATLKKGLGYGLDEAALKFIKERYRFKPATFRGQPIARRISFPITYAIE